MKWLIIGVTRKEIREKGYTMPTNDFILMDRGDFGPFRREDIDFKGDCFDIELWTRILTIFGPASFDVIMMDGGLFGMRRVDEIVGIKRRLLKTEGYCLHFTGIAGERVRCPFGRPILFYKIPRKYYSVHQQDALYDRIETSTLSGILKKRSRLIL